MRLLWTLYGNGVLAHAYLEDLEVNGVELIIMLSDSTLPRSERFVNAILAQERAASERARLLQAGWTDCAT